MSEENIDVVRLSYEAVNADEEPPREMFDADYEFDASEVAVGIGVVRGFDAVDKALREYWQTFDHFHLELTEILHADKERVVTAVRDGGRIRGSDDEIWNHLFHVWTFRDGKVLRLSSHADRNRALEAAGLSE
jgi:ketosteroid isomerase-like protein